MNYFYEVLVEFANTNCGRGRMQIKLSDKLGRLENLRHVYCLTLDLPIRIDANYEIISKFPLLFPL